MAEVRVRVPLGALATVPYGRSVQTFPLQMGCPQGREGSTPSGAFPLSGPVAERQTHHVDPLVRLARLPTRDVDQPGVVACLGRTRTLVRIQPSRLNRPRGAARSARHALTVEVAGSNPAADTDDRVGWALVSLGGRNPPAPRCAGSTPARHTEPPCSSTGGATVSSTGGCGFDPHRGHCLVPGRVV